MGSVAGDAAGEGCGVEPAEGTAAEAAPSVTLRFDDVEVSDCEPFKGDAFGFEAPVRSLVSLLAGVAAGGGSDGLLVTSWSRRADSCVPDRLAGAFDAYGVLAGDASDGQP